MLALSHAVSTKTLRKPTTGPSLRRYRSRPHHRELVSFAAGLSLYRLVEVGSWHLSGHLPPAMTLLGFKRGRGYQSTILGQGDLHMFFGQFHGSSRGRPGDRWSTGGSSLEDRTQGTETTDQMLLTQARGHTQGERQ